MKQGKQLSNSKIQEIVVLGNIGKGGKKIARATKTSKSTVHKYQKLSQKLRELKKNETIDNSWRIIEKADEVTLDRIEDPKVTAKDTAVISKLMTDRMLDLTDPTRAGNKTLVVIQPILGKETITE